MRMGQPHQTIVMLHTYYVGSTFCNSKEGSSLHLLLFEILPFPGFLFIGQKSSSSIPVGISEKGWVIACSPRWYMTWLFLSFPTFGYLIKYLTELKKPKSYTI